MDAEFYSAYSIITNWLHEKYDIFRNLDECHFFCHFLSELETENNA